MNLLGLVIPWWGRWAGIALAFVAAAGFGAAKMHAHDQAKYDAREAEIKAAAEKQNALNQQIIAAHIHQKELSDVQADKMRLERDAAVFAANRRLRELASTRLVPAVSPGPKGSGRICYAADELDRKVREALGEAAAEDVGDAAIGQAGVDAASLCRDWANRL